MFLLKKIRDILDFYAEWFGKAIANLLSFENVPQDDEKSE